MATTPTTAPASSTTTKKRVISGMRPTGKMHIGNYFGALANWVRLQNEVVEGSGSGSPLATRHSPLPSYDCFYFIADWHSLTSDYADTSAISQNVIEIATDYLAGGLDPDKSVIFLQSLVPEHAELHLLLSMVTPLGWLERVPTYKEALENVKDKDLHNYGFLGYPVLQCADIVMYSEPGTSLIVPVGEDQVSHVELSREIVRRFNNFYATFGTDGSIYASGNEKSLKTAEKLMFAAPEQKLAEKGHNMLARGVQIHAQKIGYDNFCAENPALAKFFPREEVLNEPDAMLTQTPRIPGLDGRKMSKSYGNTIMLSESDEDIRAKTKVMVTDPARKRRTDPGNPEKCPVWDWHKLFSTPERDPGRLDWVWQGCTTAGIGCIECKAAMADNLIKWIAPIRERRVEYEQHPARVLEVIDAGSKRARAVAQGTMSRVREAVFGWQRKRAEIKASTVQVHDTHA